MTGAGREGFDCGRAEDESDGERAGLRAVDGEDERWANDGRPFSDAHVPSLIKGRRASCDAVRYSRVTLQAPSSLTSSFCNHLPSPPLNSTVAVSPVIFSLRVSSALEPFGKRSCSSTRAII